RHADASVWRGLIRTAAGDRRIADPVHGAREVPEREEDRDRAQQRADVRTGQQPCERADPDEALVQPDLRGCRLSHVVASTPEGWATARPPTPALLASAFR